jgi:hypothetical protein
MVIADSTGSTLSTIFSAFAVVAALWTVYYARQTVGEAKKTTEEERKLLVAVEASRTDAARQATREFSRELIVQRLAVLSRIAPLLRQIAEQARDEVGAVNSVIERSSIPVIVANLKVEVALFRTARGELPEEFDRFLNVAPVSRRHPQGPLGQSRELLLEETVSMMPLVEQLVRDNAQAVETLLTWADHIAVIGIDPG